MTVTVTEPAQNEVSVVNETTVVVVQQQPAVSVVVDDAAMAALLAAHTSATGPRLHLVQEPKPRLIVHGLHPNASDSATDRGSEATPYRSWQAFLTEMQPGYAGAKSSLIGDAGGGRWACDVEFGPGPQFYVLDPPWGGWDAANPPWSYVSADGETPYSDTGNAATDKAAVMAAFEIHYQDDALYMPNFVRVKGKGAAGKEADSTGHPGGVTWIVGPVDNDYLLAYGSDNGTKVSGQDCEPSGFLITNYGIKGGCIQAGKEIPLLKMSHVGAIFANGWAFRLAQAGMDTAKLEQCVAWSCGQALADGAAALGEGGGIFAGPGGPNMFTLEGCHSRQNFGHELLVSSGGSSTGGSTRLIQVRVGTGLCEFQGKGLLVESFYWEQGESQVNRGSVMLLNFAGGDVSDQGSEWPQSFVLRGPGRLHGIPVTKPFAASASYAGGKLRIYLDRVPAYVPWNVVGDEVQLHGWTSPTDINTDWTVASTDGATYIEITMADPGTVSVLGTVDMGRATSDQLYGDGSTQLVPVGIDVRCGMYVRLDADRYIGASSGVGKFLRYDPTYIADLRYRIVGTLDLSGNKYDTRGWAYEKEMS